MSDNEIHIQLGCPQLDPTTPGAQYYDFNGLDGLFSYEQYLEYLKTQGVSMGIVRG